MSNIPTTINNKLLAVRRVVENKQSSEQQVRESFDSLLLDFVKLGHYSTSSWPITYTSKWWGHFVALGKSKYIGYFLGKISEHRNMPGISLEELEPLDYLDMELRWAQCSGQEDIHRQTELITMLTEKYPYNIEFVHTYAHILSLIPGRESEAHAKYKQCFLAWGQRGTPPESIQAEFNRQMLRANSLIEDSSFLDAEIELDSMSSFSFYTSDPIYNNSITAMRQRIRDRKFTHAKALEIERNVKENIRAESDAQNKKSIEQLGLFSAVITFIVTAAASSFNSDKALTPVILIAIGLVLVVLLTTISLCNNPPKYALKDKRSWVLAAYLFVTLTIVFVEASKPSVYEVVSKSVSTQLGNKYDEAYYNEQIEKLISAEIKKQQESFNNKLEEAVSQKVTQLSNQAVPAVQKK
ncbi:hypothetical protein ACJ5M8_001782 [Vibrio antiquarius]